MEVTEGLRRDHHGRDSLHLASEKSCTGLYEVAGGGIRHAAELAVKGSVEEERWCLGMTGMISNAGALANP